MQRTVNIAGALHLAFFALREATNIIAALRLSNQQRIIIETPLKKANANALKINHQANRR